MTSTVTLAGMSKTPIITPVIVDSPLAESVSGSSETEVDQMLNTESLSESITDYPTYWGRRYHRYHEGAYLYPNDDLECERLNQLHEIFNLHFDGRLYWSPLDPDTATKVLDLGTGTGQWPIDLSDSDLLPKAEITGIDLSIIQPEVVPKNVFFEIQDCSEPDWYREEDSIDLIHSRFMAGSFVSYKNVIRTSRKYLKPGTGWLELHELHPCLQCDDGTMKSDWPLKRWEETMDYASTKKLKPPRPLRVADELKEWMQLSGFVDVSQCPRGRAGPPPSLLASG
ncbi:hypothetical protein DV737_g2732, partial [Chaetothyriales sp. CBS 132003]